LQRGAPAMAVFDGTENERLIVSWKLIDVKLDLFRQHLSDKTEQELLDEIAEVLPGIADFSPRHYWSILDSARLAFQHADPSVGSRIIAAVSARAIDFAEQNPEPAATLFLRLAQLTSRNLQEPAAAKALAQSGLDALDALGTAAEDDKRMAVRKQLLQHLVDST
jgi:hypothetical protein